MSPAAVPDNVRKETNVCQDILQRRMICHKQELIDLVSRKLVYEQGRKTREGKAEYCRRVVCNDQSLPSHLLFPLKNDYEYVARTVLL